MWTVGRTDRQPDMTNFRNFAKAPIINGIYIYIYDFELYVIYIYIYTLIFYCLLTRIAQSL